MKLAGLFFVTAILYAAVGFGGGSTYTALLVLVDTDFVILPAIALICNIIVVTGGTLRFHAKKLIPWAQVWPLFALSVPLAWLGGRVLIDESLFVALLGSALFIAGLLMLFQPRASAKKDHKALGMQIPLMGAGLGFISGLVGIGGGIFLAPVLHLLKWGHAKVIAGVCSAFILVNSVAGLAGQLAKLDDLSCLSSLMDYWPLFLAVFVGGQIGSHAGAGWLDPKWVRMITALLILFVAMRLLIRTFRLIS